ncbi:hypothetical protein G9A89_004879 [Geosiphon pyriformis]|nr:hypothetical protein G9A89_004879 [Geosiphon pyriformis]
MNQVRSELAYANLQEIVTKINEKCFAKCISKPGYTLENSEKACVSKCMDRYMEAWNIVSRAYLSRVQRENQQGGGADWYWSSAIEKLKKDRPTSNALYENFVNFWKEVLIETTRRGWLGPDLLCIEVNDVLNQNFSYELDNNGTLSPPTIKGLLLVIQELYERNELVRIHGFKGALTESWASWFASRLLLGPIWWGYEHLVIGVKEIPDPGRYIFLATLKEVAERIVKHHNEIAHGITDDLCTYSSFKEEYGKIAMPDLKLSDADWDILLTYLEYGRHILIARTWEEEKLGNKQEIAIKFRSKDDTTNTKLQIGTTLEHGILNIKATSENLHKQIESLETRVNELTKRINYYIGRKQKNAAKLALRQKKEIEKILDKRFSSLHTLEGILLKMQESVTYREVLDAFDFGANTLQNVLSNSGVTADSVQDTIDKLEDTLIAQNEIEEAMTAANTTISLAHEDDDELERELEALQKTQSIPKASKALPESEDTDILEVKRMFEELNVLPNPSQVGPMDLKLEELSVIKDTVPTTHEKAKTENQVNEDSMFMPAY